MIYAKELKETLEKRLAVWKAPLVPMDRETVLDMIDVLDHIMRDLGDFSTEPRVSERGKETE